MGKLMKYEFRKQLTSKVVIGILAAITEIAFLIGIIIDDEEWAGISLGCLMILAVVGLCYISFETIITYSNDMKTKQSYMLFLVPRNMYQVVGAKMLTTVIQIVGAGAAFAAIGIADVFVIFAKNEEIEEFFEVLNDFLTVLGMAVHMNDVIYVLALILITWLEFVLLAIFAITLSTTFFANTKYKGFFSFGIYFVLNLLLSKVANYVSDGFGQKEYLMISAEGWIYIGIYTAAMILWFFGTSWLLDKKVSV